MNNRVRIVFAIVFFHAAVAASQQPADPAFALKFGAAISGHDFVPADTSYPRPFPEYDFDRTSIVPWRAAVIGGALTAVFIGLDIYQRNSWWKGQRGEFHIAPDNDYALQVDKVGHFYGGALSTFIGRKSAQWTGFSDEASVWVGALIGTTFELWVEYQDGFATDWGFSPGDAIMDVAGALYPVAQHYVPPLAAFQPKFSYYPSNDLLEGRHKGGNIIDDYQGQTYWMGIQVHELLPPSWKPYWPEWLGLALGVSARNLSNRDERFRGVIVSLDYDVTKIIPGDSWFLRSLKEGLNFVHFPAPAVRISPDVVFYGLYFN